MEHLHVNQRFISSVFRRRTHKRTSTDDVDRRAAIGNGASNSNDYTTNDERKHTVAARRQSDTSDHDYIYVDTLAMHDNQRRDADMSNILTEGQYRSAKDSHDDVKDNVELITTPQDDDVIMVENAGYEGLGLDHRYKEAVKSSEVVMVENAGYEGVEVYHGGDTDNVNSTEVVMMENKNYEGIASE